MHVIARSSPASLTNVSPCCARRRKIAGRSKRVSSGFSIYVAKENLKFSAAHFIAYPGFREPLHGHNYQVGVRVEGRLSETGYVLDFGLIKKLTREIADRLDEHTIIPAKSDCLRIEQDKKVVKVYYEEDQFAFPAKDVA